MSKRKRRHIVLAAGSVLLTFMLYLAFGMTPERWVDIPDPKADSPFWRISMALAYSALIFLGITLALGPINLLRKRKNPVSFMLRRDVGIWAAILALAHMSVGMFIHTNGWKVWQLFMVGLPSAENLLPVRLSKFGLVNYLGLFQATILIGLLLISNNWMMRHLGTRRWKNMQRLVYVAFFSIFAHGYFYQQIERRDERIVTLFIFLMVSMLVIQLLGIWQFRRQYRHPHAAEYIEAKEQ